LSVLIYSIFVCLKETLINTICNTFKLFFTLHYDNGNTQIVSKDDITKLPFF